MLPWIKCTDQLPTEKKWYYVVVDGGCTMREYLPEEKQWAPVYRRYYYPDHDSLSYKVSHWLDPTLPIN